MTKNISPIKKKPLHLPGQSLEEHIQYLINDKAGGYIAMAVFSLALAAFEWIQFYNPVPYFHIYWTITAIIVIAFCAFKVMQIRKTVKKLQQGLEGEREVGHFLEQLRAHGYQIFHDIPADNFNIDHVVISEYGLFTIETKTLSRPEKGRFKIIVKGDTVHTPFNQYSQITPQAQGEARWLRETLQNSTGNLYPVQPVVLFPGWYVESGESNKTVWFLNPKGLPAFISHQPKVLTPEEVMLITDRLCRIVRDKDDN